VAALFKSALVAGGFDAADVAIMPVDDTAFLIARWKGRDPKLKPLVISGHMDVVEAKASDWERDPFTPVVENGLLYEWAHAQLTRELFPDCPVKYMPPTKHIAGNLFMTHACDTLFNLITVATDQEIQTIGIPTEGIFTPHIHDRVLGMECSNYVFTAARGLSDEIEFKPDGFIVRRAHEVLREAHAMLEEILDIGLFAALGRGMFGDVSRTLDGGRGSDGIYAVAEDYLNPLHGAVEAPAGV